MFMACCIASLTAAQLLWSSHSPLWWLWMILAFVGTLMFLVAITFALYGVTHCPRPRLPCMRQALRTARSRYSAGEISHQDYRRIKKDLRTGI